MTGLITELIHIRLDRQIDLIDLSRDFEEIGTTIGGALTFHDHVKDLFIGFQGGDRLVLVYWVVGVSLVGCFVGWCLFLCWVYLLRPPPKKVDGFVVLFDALFVWVFLVVGCFI